MRSSGQVPHPRITVLDFTRTGERDTRELSHMLTLSCLFTLPCEDTARRWPSESQEVPYQNLPCCILISDFQPTELCENKFSFMIFWLEAIGVILLNAVKYKYSNSFSFFVYYQLVYFYKGKFLLTICLLVFQMYNFYRKDRKFLHFFSLLFSKQFDLSASSTVIKNMFLISIMKSCI